MTGGAVQRGHSGHPLRWAVGVGLAVGIALCFVVNTTWLANPRISGQERQWAKQATDMATAINDEFLLHLLPATMGIDEHGGPTTDAGNHEPDFDRLAVSCRRLGRLGSNMAHGVGREHPSRFRTVAGTARRIGTGWMDAAPTCTSAARGQNVQRALETMQRPFLETRRLRRQLARLLPVAGCTCD